ncbi:hypothetical protein [Rhizobium johnstonii]|uniref:hypothetical protein n=1 Tax=Rhizobium johnstonii TaxID=3019933 RepID=UPI003F9DC8BB
MMEQITLEPGVWTHIYGCFLQATSAKAIRVTLGEPTQSVDGHVFAVTPDLDAPYFRSQGYDPQVIDLRQWGFSELVNIYVMPDDDQPIDVVVL